MTETTTGGGFSVPSFDDETKPKTRNPRKKAEAKAAAKLLEALDFVGHASDITSNFAFARHIRFINGWAVSYDGCMRAGHPIEEDLNLCPHVGHLKSALAKAGASLALSALDSGRLSVAGGKFRAVVPCAPPDAMPPVFMDPSIAPLDDRVKAGFAAVLRLAKDEAETLIERTLLLRANTVVGCNGNLMLEYYHGNDLPPNMAVPQAFAKAVVKISNKLVGFGWTEGRSITFHYEGGAWIATQLGEGQWPNVEPLLNADTPNLEDCPKDLFPGLDAVTSFSDDGAIHFHAGKINSTYANDGSDSPVYGAAYDVEGLEAGHSFTAKLLKLAESACARIDYKTHSDRIIMYNSEQNIRGVLMKRLG